MGKKCQLCCRILGSIKINGSIGKNWVNATIPKYYSQVANKQGVLIVLLLFRGEGVCWKISENLVNGGGFNYS